MPNDSGYGEGGFYRVVSDAVDHFARHGYVTITELTNWRERIARAAREAFIPEQQLLAVLRSTYQRAYARLVERGGVLRRHPGVGRFTLDKLAPRLREELSKFVASSANLIKLNREQAVAATMRRFEGWAASIPAGGSRAVDKRDTRDDMKKEIRALRFQDRRVMIDQGHKLESSISQIIAVDAGAIAGVWHSNWRQANYDYRHNHRARDGKLYMVRGNWAQEKGLVRASDNGYTDEITRPAEEPYCRCYYQWIYSVSRLPEDMITAIGREALDQVRMRAA